jgi:hypothetical protein
MKATKIQLQILNAKLQCAIKNNNVVFGDTNFDDLYISATIAIRSTILSPELTPILAKINKNQTVFMKQANRLLYKSYGLEQIA